MIVRQAAARCPACFLGRKIARLLRLGFMNQTNIILPKLGNPLTRVNLSQRQPRLDQAIQVPEDLTKTLRFNNTSPVCQGTRRSVA
jgi:hypothetical protein